MIIRYRLSVESLTRFDQYDRIWEIFTSVVPSLQVRRAEVDMDIALIGGGREREGTGLLSRIFF